MCGVECPGLPRQPRPLVSECTQTRLVQARLYCGARSSTSSLVLPRRRQAPFHRVTAAGAAALSVPRATLPPMAGQKDSLRWGSVILGFGLLALDAALDGVRRLCHRARLWPGPTKPIGALTNDEIDALP